MDGITGETEDQKRGEKISDEARAAIDENCLAWVRKVTGNPAATVLPLAQERVYEISDLVWSLAYRAGREDEARSQAAAALDFERGFQVGRRAGQEDAIRRAIDLLRLERDKAADADDRDYVYALVGARKLVEGVLRTEPDLPGSDGVQPTEEQRAEDEDQKRSEEQDRE